MQRVRRNDTVMVIAGRDRGKTGTVRRVLPKDDRLVVQGVNIIKKHMRARPPSQPGGIIEREAPLHISNVMPICTRCSHPTRVGYHRREDCGEDMD